MAARVGGEISLVVKCHFEGIERSIESRHSKNLLTAGAASYDLQVRLSVHGSSVAFFVIRLIGYHADSAGSGYCPAIRFYHFESRAVLVAAEGLQPWYGERYARSLECRLRRQTLFVCRAVGAYVELILGLFVQAAQCDGFSREQRGCIPVHLFAFFHQYILVLRCIALPCEGSTMCGKATQYDVGWIFAAGVSYDRYTLYFIKVYAICTAGLVETDVDSLTYISAEVQGVLSPFALPKPVRGITLGLRSIIRVEQFERTGVCAAERHFDAELS